MCNFQSFRPAPDSNAPRDPWELYQEHLRRMRARCKPEYMQFIREYIR